MATNRIKFISEIEISEMEFIKVRFEESFPGFKQNLDGDFEQTNVNEVIMFKSKFLAQVFTELPLLALAYTRTENFLCIKAALSGAECELKRALVRDEDSEHDRYDTLIRDIKVPKAIQALLDEELAKAFA